MNFVCCLSLTWLTGETHSNLKGEFYSPITVDGITCWENFNNEAAMIKNIFFITSLKINC